MTPFDYALGMFHNDAIIEIAGPTYCLLDHFSTGMRRQKIRPDGSIDLSAIANPNLAPDAHTNKVRRRVNLVYR